MYERPSMQPVTELAEGVFMASGEPVDEGKNLCRYFRSEFNPGSDTCQCCSATGGKYDDESKIDINEAIIMGYEVKNDKVQSFKPEHAKECPDKMPRKQS